MIKIVITEPAETDIKNIYFYIASNSYEAFADAFIDKILKRFEIILANPNMGVNRYDLGIRAPTVPICSAPHIRTIGARTPLPK